MSHDLLAKLHDIHLPTPLSVWPPAPIWFVLFFLFFGAVFSASLIYYRQYKKKQLKRTALAQLQRLKEALNEKKYYAIAIADLSTLVRKIALAKFPRQDVAGLHGQAWLAFLDKTSQTDLFSQGVGRLLITAPYTREKPGNIESLFSLVNDWIEENA